jgi:hypothetical protein
MVRPPCHLTALPQAVDSSRPRLAAARDHLGARNYLIVRAGPPRSTGSWTVAPGSCSSSATTATTPATAGTTAPAPGTRSSAACSAPGSRYATTLPTGTASASRWNRGHYGDVPWGRVTPPARVSCVRRRGAGDPGPRAVGCAGTARRCCRWAAAHRAGQAAVLAHRDVPGPDHDGPWRDRRRGPWREDPPGPALDQVAPREPSRRKRRVDAQRTWSRQTIKRAG